MLIKYTFAIFDNGGKTTAFLVWNFSVCMQGTLRVLLVLLHDFPEFLCDYHYGFCDVIPPNCIQLRNLILSAFPRNMRLPDPFTPNLKVKFQQMGHVCFVLPLLYWGFNFYFLNVFLIYFLFFKVFLPQIDFMCVCLSSCAADACGTYRGNKVVWVHGTRV